MKIRFPTTNLSMQRNVAWTVARASVACHAAASVATWNASVGEAKVGGGLPSLPPSLPRSAERREKFDVYLCRAETSVFSPSPRDV